MGCGPSTASMALPSSRQETPVAAAAPVLPQFTLEEVATHCSPSDCWMVLYGQVLDVTEFMQEHPGGEEFLMEGAGIDATDLFDPIHSQTARDMVQRFTIGSLKRSQPFLTVTSHMMMTPSTAGRAKKSPEEEFHPYTLLKCRALTHDTDHYTFEVPDGSPMASFSPGQHLYIRMPQAGAYGGFIARPYTPVYFSRSHFELVVKRYADGAVSNFLHSVPVGSTVHARGPVSRYKHEESRHRDVVFLGMGTGITPLFSVLYDLISSGLPPHVTMYLLYASRSVEDILLRQELLELKTALPNPAQLRIVHFLSSPDPVSSSSEEDLETFCVGRRFTVEDLQAHLPQEWFDRAREWSGDSPRFLICGSDPFMQTMVDGLTGALQVHMKNIFAF